MATVTSISLPALEPSLKALPRTAFVLFKSEWCPDCVRCKSGVRAATKAAGVPLLEVDVGAAAAWRTPAHPLRTDPRFQLSGIPTMFLWRDGAPGAKLGSALESAPTEAEATRAATEFVQQHSA